MLYANHALTGEKIPATPGELLGMCPECDQMLRAKCGEVVEWHWAHINDTGCAANQHEPETEWHREWKAKFPKSCVEISIGEHRADVLTPRSLVVEFQHSGINPAQIAAREAEYKNMVWVLDAREASLDGRILVSRGPGYLKIDISRWRTTLKYFTRPVFLDIESWPGMLHVRDFSQRKQTNAERWRGEVQTNWGYGGSYDDFVKSIMDTKPLPSWMQSPKYNIKK